MTSEKNGMMKYEGRGLTRNLMGWLFFFMMSAAGVPFSSAQSLPSLFQAAPQGTPGATAIPVSRDQMLAAVDFSLLSGDAAPDRIQAALPDRTVIIKKTKMVRRGEGDYSWFGKVEGFEYSDAIFTVVGGILVGHINIDGQAYSLDPKNGLFLITKNDESLAVPPGEDVLIPPLPAGAPQKAGEALPSGPLGAANDGTLIDIMVLYTQAFETKYGTAVSSTIQAMIDTANTAYTNSGVNTQVRLVHSELFTDSTVSETNSISTALTNFTSLSSVATLRSTYKADLVSLFRVYDTTLYSSSSCGLAWMMYRNGVSSSFSSYGFSVVEVKRASEGSGTYCRDNTMVHEMGHNMGCAHDRTNYTSCNESNPDNNCPAYSYSYGYGVSGTFGTIMSYFSPRIEYFSTPNKTYGSYPLGIASGQSDAADCVSTFNNTTPIVAQFQLGTLSDSTAPTAVSVSIDSGASSTTSTSVTLSLSATDAVGVTGYYASETNTTPGASNSGWVTVSSSTSYTASVSYTFTNTNDGTKTVYVWFKDAAGNVSGSASDSITLAIPPSGSVVINSGQWETSSGNVTLSLSATDITGVTGYYASETNTTPGASDSGWVTVSSSTSYTADVSFTLSSGNGTKTVYVWFKDAAGNVSSGASDSILYFVPSVPALTDWGMVLLVIGILGAGLFRSRRRITLWT